jgi:hypothetical protein
MRRSCGIGGRQEQMFPAYQSTWPPMVSQPAQRILQQYHRTDIFQAKAVFFGGGLVVLAVDGLDSGDAICDVTLSSPRRPSEVAVVVRVATRRSGHEERSRLGLTFLPISTFNFNGGSRMVGKFRLWEECGARKMAAYLLLFCPSCGFHAGA